MTGLTCTPSIKLLSETYNAHVVECSAKTGMNARVPFEDVCRVCTCVLWFVGGKGMDVWRGGVLCVCVLCVYF